MTLNDLTVNFNHLNRESLLEDWRWLVGPSLQVILVSAIGDAFLQSEEDNHVFLLDTAAGELLPVADNEAGFRSLLTDKQFVINYFAVQMVGNLLRSGNVLKAGQIYSFKQPPALGGSFTLNNVEATDISVHFALTGQLLQQIKELPPNTQVENVSIAP